MIDGKQLEDRHQPRRASVLSAGLAGAASSSAGSVLVDWVSSRAKRFASLEVMDRFFPKSEPVTEGLQKVSFMTLFSFSTTQEVWLMLAGLVSSSIAGLSMPVWLLLLAQSLETFNNIGKIVNAGGDISVLQDEMDKLVISFAVLGAVSLFSGAMYVSLWTYTGERQALRIRELFVRGIFRQELAWLDRRGKDPQELPTLAANGLLRINDAIGRTVADTFANLLSAVCCLAVAIALDPPLVCSFLASLWKIVANFSTLCLSLVSLYVLFLGPSDALRAAGRGDLHCNCKLLYAQAIGPGPGAVCVCGSICYGSNQRNKDSRVP